MALVARLPGIDESNGDRRRGIFDIPGSQPPITRRHLPQRRRQPVIVRPGRLHLALHRRKLLIHRRHNQPRPGRRITQSAPSPWPPCAPDHGSAPEPARPCSATAPPSAAASPNSASNPANTGSRLVIHATSRGRHPYPNRSHQKARPAPSRQPNRRQPPHRHQWRQTVRAPETAAGPPQPQTPQRSPTKTNLSKSPAATTTGKNYRRATTRVVSASPPRVFVAQRA